MKTPSDLKPGDKCYLVSRDWKCTILTVREVQGNSSHWINFVEPRGGVFCAADVKEFTRVYPGGTLFFDKERALTYLNQKVAKINKDIAKIEKS